MITEMFYFLFLFTFHILTYINEKCQLWTQSKELSQINNNKTSISMVARYVSIQATSESIYKILSTCPVYILQAYGSARTMSDILSRFSFLPVYLKILQLKSVTRRNKQSRKCPLLVLLLFCLLLCL